MHIDHRDEQNFQQVPGKRQFLEEEVIPGLDRECPHMGRDKEKDADAAEQLPPITQILPEIEPSCLERVAAYPEQEHGANQHVQIHGPLGNLAEQAEMDCADAGQQETAEDAMDGQESQQKKAHADTELSHGLSSPAASSASMSVRSSRSNFPAWTSAVNSNGRQGRIWISYPCSRRESACLVHFLR